MLQVPLHFAQVPFLLFDGGQAVTFRLYIWPTLKAMRAANGRGVRDYAVGLCWQRKGRLFASIHLAKTYLAHDVIIHECNHAAAQLRRLLHLDDDEHDEETNCEIAGLFARLVVDEVRKVAEPV